MKKQKQMQKPILIAISVLIILGVLIYGLYLEVNKAFDKGFEEGEIVGREEGFQLTGQAILKQLAEEGKLVVTFNDQNGNPQQLTLIPE